MVAPITDTVSIYHRLRSANTESWNGAAAYTNVDATISPTETDIQTSEGGEFSYQIFELFIWDITIQLYNGDKVVSEDGTNYLVTGSPNAYSNRYVQAIRTLVKVVM